jgi:putative nucleotidyltransferase with HDIG domain
MRYRAASAAVATAEGNRGAIAIGAFVAIALFAILFPWFPGGIDLSAGSTATRTIVAPRSTTYESEILTEQLRQAAAEAVQDVRVQNTEVRGRQLDELDGLLLEINDARTNLNLSASARESEIRRIPAPELTAEAAATFAGVSDIEWAAFAAEARTALGTTLGDPQGISEEGLDDARERAVGALSPLLTVAQRDALAELITPLVRPTLTVDTAATEQLREEARRSVTPVSRSFATGTIVVTEGEVLGDADVEALAELDIWTGGIDVSSIVATAIVSILGGAALGGFLGVMKPASLGSARRMLLFALLLLVPVAVAKFAYPLIFPDLDRYYLAHALPIVAGPMAAAVLLEVSVAVFLALVLTGLATFIATYLPSIEAAGDAAQLELARVTLATGAGAMAGILVAVRADRLQRHLVAGLAAAGASAAAVLGVWLVDADRGAVDLVWIAGASVVGGLMAALVTVGTFVLLSRPFGIITRVELMELAQLNHPLLRRLQDEAPGTFQHSILVGNLAERAADRIGADALLVRVGAYYHDIGKLVSPQFFAENIAGDENPHEGLDPLQSTRVIFQHVTGGVEMARREGLPDAIVRFIPEHHGTRTASYFYRRAAEADPEIDPELFRYPGPKPRTKETALVMLADASEATVRASNDRSPERIREIIDATIRERIAEGQFDDCDISMRDLNTVAESYSRALAAVYHPRVEYPEPTERELREREPSALPSQGGKPGDRDGERPPRSATPPRAPVAAPSTSTGADDDELMPPERASRRAAEAPPSDVGEDDA